MNDACPSAARLTEFAQTPLQEENVDIAVHILQCRDCAKKLYLMNQIILSHCEVTQDEWAEIKSFRPHRNSPANNLWQKVEHFLNSVFPTDFEFIHVYEKQPQVATSGKEPPHVNRPVTSEDSKASQHVNLVFKADCDDEDLYFWTASLQIDLSAGNNDLQLILVTDRSRNPIAHGLLLLCGQLLPVSGGKAYISLEDFRRNLRSQAVALQFATGERVSGSLTFALEGM